MKRKPTILVVDDERFVLDSLVDVLEAEGWRTATAESAESALKRLARDRIDAVITDLNLPAASGLELLAQAKGANPRLPVMVITGVGKVADAVEAMKRGAYDFIQKPVDPEELILLVTRALEHGELLGEVTQLRNTLGELRAATPMVGASSWFQELGRILDQVAASNAFVLITGESGTGKELVAAEIHRRSRRASRSLVRVNCAAISETLFESEFFGHRRGAFTSAVEDRAGRFAEAEGGTIVLDEIGTLRPEMQAKLLRVLESGEYQVVGESATRVADVRVVAITNEDLAARVKDGRFRSDLYYRLNVFPIAVPPLRMRRDDIVVLAEHLYDRVRGAGAAATSAGPRLDAEAIDVLRSYDWPGNVRELRNVIERAVILAGGEPPGAALFRGILESGSLAAVSARSDSDLTLRTRLDQLEAELIQSALRRTQGSKREAAELLGIDPKNFAYYQRKHRFGERAEPSAPAEGEA